MRCQGHVHIQGQGTLEGSLTTVECDLEEHDEKTSHGGWLRVGWTQGHSHDEPIPTKSVAEPTSNGAE